MKKISTNKNKSIYDINIGDKSSLHRYIEKKLSCFEMNDE